MAESTAAAVLRAAQVLLYNSPMAERPVTATLVLLLALAAPASIARAQSPPSAQARSTQTAPAATPESTDLNLRAYVELLRSDLRTQKVAIITQMMEFTEAEDAAFWPIYREYDLEMSKLGDERVALIEEYARTYSQMTDSIADRLATKALDLESRRQALKSKYYERFKQAMSPRTAAKFLQVEQQILLLIDLQISAELPIIK
jgi:hypothetical protein